MNLKVQHCRGQCYDGASVMTGCRKGAAKIINDNEAGAIYTHWYGHVLNLSVGDTIRQRQVMKATMDVGAEILKLLKKSPKCDSVFEKIKAELTPDYAGFHVLCPTRWTVWAASLQSVLEWPGLGRITWLVFRSSTAMPARAQPCAHAVSVEWLPRRLSQSILIMW